MTNEVVLFFMNLTLVIVVGLLIPAFYRVIKGPRVADRLLGVDMITTLLIGSVVLLAVIAGQAILVDVALAVAALSFIATLAIARFVGEGRVF
jgi:multicomponent Na+:H+ antiporter subunit F